MQKMIDAILAAMQSAGFSVQKSKNAGKLTRLSAAKTAISLQKVCCEAPADFSYRGMHTQENGLRVPLYGCRASCEAVLKVCAPRVLGAAACEQEAQSVMRFLLGGIDGVRITKLELGPCVFEPEADLFSSALTLAAEGVVYALANEDDTEFTDFILKGEIQ